MRNVPAMRNELPSPALPTLPPRAASAHKGDFGRGLLIGGSFAMPGAIAMAGLAAATSGAGLVRLAVPSCIANVVAGYSPCSMLLPLPFNEVSGTVETELDFISSALAKADCVAIGPGLGRSESLDRLLPNILRTANCPIVVDADGLNALGTIDALCDAIRPRQQPSRIVLTPHPGEWQRLSGVASTDREAQVEAAIEFAARAAVVVLLKGQHTVVTDGESIAINRTGTPAMATGGSGDVLTGILTALICQGLDIRDAAHLAAHVHGLAAEKAEQRLGYHVVLPTELIASLPGAFAQLAVD
ncbi:MAG: hypothetical protein Aurels2KO_17750 [Aureliella sp.]